MNVYITGALVAFHHEVYTLFTVRHVFVGCCGTSGIRNVKFLTLFLLLFVENHFAFTICFGISFFLLQNIKREVSEVFLACSRH